MINEEDKIEAVDSATKVMLEYMGTAKEFQLKIDKGLKYLKGMLASLLVILVMYIGSEIYRTLNPPASQIDMQWIVQQQRSIAEQRESLTIQKQKIVVDMAKNTSDALINLAAQKALATDRADIAVARAEILTTLKGAITRDSLFNQKKPEVKTVNK